MFVVLFEVQPKREQWDRYLELAAMLRPELVQIRGFIDNERYTSDRTEGRLLSLSTWEDEKSLVRWRTLALHHGVQRQGRFEVFEDYHLRVGEVSSDRDHDDLDHSRLDVTEIGGAPAVTVTETPPGGRVKLPPPSADLLDAESYSGITFTGKRLMLASWCGDDAAGAWIERQPAGARHRHIRIIRDYGMHRREEAPQYFPAMDAVSVADE
ncbi:MAG TPA: antibiotic biosynthesis monooxygenase [Solirubrobacteraceae bacterium]|jgi:heme-degrading monooxygenase HmoA|nr:antibiotic biosynthesis monooxygenase [Solirubrobacteraceae bacterium]